MSLLFVGDVALGSSTAFRLECGNAMVVANVEGPVLATASEAASLAHPYSTADALSGFFGAQLVMACVANNHAADLGAPGLRASASRLASLGAAVVGARAEGTTAADAVGDVAVDAAYRQVDGQRVAFLARVAHESFGTDARASAAAALVHALSEQELHAAVVRERATCDRVVVMLHWGQEWLTVPSPERINLARALVDSGADLVIGHHAHVVETFERHADRVIAYGLGTIDLRFPNHADVGRGKPRDGKARAWWARRALAVEWNADSNRARVRTLRWRGDTLRLEGDAVNSAAHTRYLRAPSRDAYARITRQDYWRSKLRTAWQERILPRPSHLRSLVGIAGEAKRASSAS